MSRALHAALRRLLLSASGQLAGSQLTAAQARALDELRMRTGAVGLQRSGRGVIYRVIERQILEQHLNELMPLAVAELDTDLPQRAGNIGLSRSSKTGQHGHGIHYLQLKAQGAVCWRSTEHGHTLDLQQATRQQGAATLTIGGDSDQSWSSDDELWLVENQAVFDRLDWLPYSEAASVAWYSGHLRTCLIDWLAQQPRASHIRLFPDYDGVGLHNYLRLRHRLGNQVSFWLMPDWDHRLRQFGNNALWQKTAADFQAAMTGLQPVLADEPEVHQLMRAMQAQGLALEQEAIWLPVQLSR